MSIASDETPVVKSSKPRWPLRRKLMLVCVIIICLLLALIWHRKGHVSPWVEGDMAPGASEALKSALGPDALERVTQIISYGNKPSAASGGTHLQSGSVHGRPYGLAFDLVILPGTNADADVRKLRLVGIVAWHRGPAAPGGPAGIGPHIHCVWAGAPTSNRQNLEQIGSFVHRYRGLADRSQPKRKWIDPSIRSDEVAAVTHVYEHLHGQGSADRLPTYDALHGR